MNVVIFGAGGLGREIFDTLVIINSNAPAYNVMGFIDDNREKGTLVNGVPVLGGTFVLQDMRGQVGMILGFADPASRKASHQKFKRDFAFPNVIHPTAVISPFASLGDGVLIQSYCIVAANAKIGNCVMMNAHSGVGHDAQISDYCSIMSYCDMAGNTKLGEMTFVGSGAKVIPNTKIFPESYLCAGAVVIKDVVTKSKLMGNPAKIIG
jgi:sugar O-acyltransferase (sialic acid O-acetyltransferase NeuD family)